MPNGIDVAGTGQLSDLELELLQQQINGRLDTPQFSAGTVDVGRGGFFDDPKNIVQLGTLPVGATAAAVRSGARGLAQFAIRQPVVGGLKPLAESLFQDAGRIAPSLAQRLAQAALTGGIGSGTVLAAAGNPLLAVDEEQLARMGTPEAQAEIQRRFIERGNEFAKRLEERRAAEKVPTLPPGTTFRDITNDPDFGNPAAFKAKYGMLPEEAMNLLEKRGQKNPAGGFTRKF